MSLRVLTYNILDGGHGREAHILEVLQTHHPDVVIMQELFDPHLLHHLAQNLNMHFFFAKGNSRRHLALLSKLPLLECHSIHPFPAIHRTILYARLAGQFSDPLHIFGVHLVAAPFVMAEAWRLWEVKTLLQHTVPFLTEPCLIAGDFNAFSPQDRVMTTHWPRGLKWLVALQGGQLFRTAVRQLLDAGWKDCFRSLHPDDDGCTLPPPVPQVRLDYIFANNMLYTHLRRCMVVREPTAVLSASDHFPVLAEFH